MTHVRWPVELELASSTSPTTWPPGRRHRCSCARAAGAAAARSSERLLLLSSVLVAARSRPRRCSLPSPLLLVAGAAAAYGRSVGRRTRELRRRRPKSCPTSASAAPAKAVDVGHQKLLVPALRYPRRLRLRRPRELLLRWEGGSAKGSKGRHVGLSWAGRARGGSGRPPPPWEMKVSRTRLLFLGVIL